MAEWFEVHEAALFLEGARRAPELLELRADAFGARLKVAIARWLPEVPPEAALKPLQDRLRAVRMRSSVDQIRAYLASERTLTTPFIAAAAEILEVDAAWLRRGGETKTTACRSLRARLAGREPGQVRTKRFLHTYAPARLQTLDNGAPVQPCTVARDLGHMGLDMINRKCGHLGVRHRSEVVEYRVEQHLEVEGYAARLQALQSA